MVQAAGSTISETALADRVERDLAAGRFQLLVVGDGITEGAQRISAFLGRHAGLAFDFGLIEMAEYRYVDPVSAEPRRILHPRVLARTAVIERHVIRNEVPGAVIEPVEDPAEPGPASRAASTGSGAEAATRWRRFVDRFVAETQFDDPAQLPPRVGGTNWMKLPLVDGLHIALWRSNGSADMGAQVRFVSPEAQLWFDGLMADRQAIADECASEDLPVPVWSTNNAGKLLMLKVAAPLPWDEAAEEAQRRWLARAGNRLINSLRPRLERLEEQG